MQTQELISEILETFFEKNDPGKPIRMQKNLWQMLYHSAKSGKNDLPSEGPESLESMENTVIVLCGILDNIYENNIRKISSDV